MKCLLTSETGGDTQPLSSAKEVRVKPTTECNDKMRIQAATVAYSQGRLSRRDYLKGLGAAGVALGSGRSFAPRTTASPAAASLL